MGLETAAAIAVVGAGVSAYGQYQAGQDQAWAAKQQAKIKRQQAGEIRERLALQTAQLEQEGRSTTAAQTSAFAKGGVQLGTGVTLIAMEDTNAKIAQEIEFTQRDAMFRIGQMESGARYDEIAGQQYKKAATISAGGTLLTGASKFVK